MTHDEIAKTRPRAESPTILARALNAFTILSLILGVAIMAWEPRLPPPPPIPTAPNTPAAWEFGVAGFDELAPLQGCADTDILFWNNTATDWECQTELYFATHANWDATAGFDDTSGCATGTGVPSPYHCN